MDRIPILRMGQFLLVTIQVDMHDRLAVQLQDDLTEKISESGARCLNRYLNAGGCRFVHWPDAGQYCGNGAGAGR